AARRRAPARRGRLRAHAPPLPPGLAPVVGSVCSRRQMRRALLLLGAGLVLGGAFEVGYRLSERSRATAPVAIPSVVDEVRDALAARYYRSVPDSVLERGSVDEILSALDDPYTAYLAPPDYRLVRQETASPRACRSSCSSIATARARARSSPPRSATTTGRRSSASGRSARRSSSRSTRSTTARRSS